jgi:Protein of unknown function (DUF4236)
MGFLFRKRIKLFPGVWFNLSKRGVRTSFGGKGLTVDIKDYEITTNDSIPDSGLSYRATPTTSDNLASSRVALMGWSLLFLAMLDGVVLLLRQ